eukprot:SAG22_NODE_3764_length_1538_cov_1.357192_1_plen_333_part_00
MRMHPRLELRLAFAALAGALSLPGAGAADHTSKLKFAACSDGEPLQRFSMGIDGPGKSGEIRDRETGRCIAVRGCSVALPFNPGGVAQPGVTLGEAVLDECGSECSGKATSWKEIAVSSGGGLVFVSEAETSACYALNAVGAYDGAHGIMAAVWNFGATCTDFSGGALNSEFTFDKEHGHLKLLNTDRASALGCPAANCCLQAEPCVAPCSLPAGAGWTFVALLLVGSGLYVAGGVAHSVQVRGVPLSAGPGQLLPHTEHWLAVLGLVQDGLVFTKARYAAYRAGQPSGGGEALLPSETEEDAAAHAAAGPPGGAGGGKEDDGGSDGDSLAE